MAIVSSAYSRPVIDLRGVDGNAFVVLAYAKQYAKALDMDVEPILREMRSSDYTNLVCTFEKYFGEYVDIIIPEALEEDFCFTGQ